jgi:predicted DNA-binding transcriptional regulator YafY
LRLALQAHYLFAYLKDLLPGGGQGLPIRVARRRPGFDKEASQLPQISSRDTISRQWELLHKLPTKGPGITSGELLEKMRDTGYRITKRTVERDLIELSRVFPLTCNDRGKPFGWHWAPGASIDLPGMSVSEALSLTLIEDTIRPLLPNGMLKALQGRFQHARKKLENMADENLAARWMSKVASVRPELNLQAPSISAEILETIQLALLEERQIACRYYSAHGNKTSELTLNPLALVQRGVATYLIGTADHYSDLRQYAVHRFLNVEIMPAACEGAAQFDLPQYLASDALQFGGPQKISLQAWVSESLARLLRETPLAEDMALQACEGGYRLTATVSDSWQLNWWMLSQGDGLVVEQPVELRHKLLETLRGTLQRYERATA